MDVLIKIAGTVTMALVLGVLFSFPEMWLLNYLFTPQTIHQIFGVWSFDLWHAFLFAVFLSSVGGWGHSSGD